jgi:hypothetical protein
MKIFIARAMKISRPSSFVGGGKMKARKSPPVEWLASLDYFNP